MDVGRRRSRAGRPGRRPAAAASRSSWSAESVASSDLVRLLAQLAAGRDRLAQAPDRRSRRRRPPPRAAGSSRPSRRPRARRAAAGARRRASGIASTIASGDAGRRAAGAAATQRRQAIRSSAVGEQLHQLHRRQDQAELGARARSSRASATHGSQRQLAGPLVAAPRAAPGRGRAPIDRVPAPGQVQGDAAGAAAELEDRPAGAPRQLLPERQVGAVGAALDVVPDHVPRRAHRQNSFARPRSASSLRSSSRAV